MSKIAYNHTGAWSSLTIYRSRTGWIVEQHSRICGSYTGGRVLYRYGHTLPADTELDADLVYALMSGHYPDKILRRAHLVR